MARASKMIGPQPKPAPGAALPPKMAKERTTAAAKEETLKNPITGMAPNSFTKSTSQKLQAPSNVRTFVSDPSAAKSMGAQRAAHEQSGGVGPDVGYQKPDGMSHHDYHWVMGQHRDRAAQNTTDINVPHDTASGAILTRRAEDLSGPEHAKGNAILKEYGTSPEKVKQDMGARMDRAAVSSVVASHPGHEAPQVTPHGERFYEGPSEPHDVISQSAGRVAAHPNFPRTGNPQADHAHARQMMAMANSATSPNNPFAVNSDVNGKKTRVYPNNNAAESAVYAGLENKEAPRAIDVGKDLQKRGVPGVPSVGSGTYQTNMDKATNATAQMVNGTPMHELRLPGTAKNHVGNQMFDAKKSPKTASYVTAHAVDYSHPDESTVVDVHEGANAFPHLSTAKSVGFHQLDESGKHVTNKNGNPVVHFVHNDMLPGGDVNRPSKELKASIPAGHSLKPAMAEEENTSRTDGMRREYGNSRIEEALSKGQPAIAPIIDHAARQAAVERGLSPSVNNATGTNRNQANRWYQQKIDRPNDPTTMTNSYHSLQGFAHPDHAWSTSAMVHDDDKAHGSSPSLHEMTQVSDYHPSLAGQGPGQHTEVARGNTPVSGGSSPLFNDRRRASR